MKRMIVITAAAVLLFGSAARVWSPAVSGIASQGRRLAPTKDGFAGAVLLAQAKTRGDDGTPLPARTPSGISTSPSVSATAAAIANFEDCVKLCERMGDACQNRGGKDCGKGQAQCFATCATKYPH